MHSDHIISCKCVVFINSVEWLTVISSRLPKNLLYFVYFAWLLSKFPLKNPVLRNQIQARVRVCVPDITTIKKKAHARNSPTDAVKEIAITTKHWRNAWIVATMVRLPYLFIVLNIECAYNVDTNEPVILQCYINWQLAVHHLISIVKQFW